MPGARFANRNRRALDRRREGLQARANQTLTPPGHIIIVLAKAEGTMRRITGWWLGAALALGGTATLAADAAVERVERGSLVLENVVEGSSATLARLAPYSNVRSAQFAAWRPDGKGMLVLTRFGQTTQIHSVAAPGAARFQLTFFDEPVGATIASPNPEIDAVVFSRDVGGNEMFQLHWMDLATGALRQITKDGTRNIQPVFRHDGGALAFGSNERNGADTDVWLWTPTEGRRILTAREGAWSPAEFSPDGKRLIVARTISINDVRLSILDIESGELTDLADVGGISTYGGGYPAVFVDGGRAVLTASSVGGEFATFRRIDLESGRERPFGPKIDWDVSEFALSPDGRRVAVAWNEDGSTVLRILDAATGAVLRTVIDGVGIAGNLAFAPDSRTVGLFRGGPQLPGDAFALDVETGTLTRWTTSEAGGLDPAGFAGAELIRYPSFDRVRGRTREIPAWLYVPEGEGPFPVVIDIHGGPEAQARPGFNAWTQFLVREMGIAVVVPNVRGSSGYGRTWLDADNGRLRMDSVRDIGALLDWIGGDARFDAGRVVVYGGSYGGFMVLASMVEYSDRLAGGVAIVAISHFRTFLENTSRYRVDLRRVEYGDERDAGMRAFMERIAPLNNAERIGKPLFVIHGANDPRVPASEAEQVLSAVRANGTEAWYMLARDEGHGFRKQLNREAMQRAVAGFFERHLTPKND
jgi:dipeptidyl aminopeptidase/acylaminoacyl peptidase